MDPLSLLRDYTLRNALDQITVTPETVTFSPSHTFPASTPTIYRNKQHGTPYPLSAAAFLALNHTLKNTDYFQSCRLNRIPHVTLPDRKPLLDFLLGHTDSLPDAVPILEPLLLDETADKVKDLDGEDHVEEPVVAKLRRLERPLKDREAILNAPGRDFFAVFTSAVKREEERQRTGSQQRVAVPVTSGAANTNMNAVAVKPKIEKSNNEGFVPIILVPSASQTLLTMYNVREFLEDGVFVPSEERLKAMKGKPEVVTVQKKLIRGERNGAGGGAAAYEVRDKPATLKPDDWGRVVAVFVLGKEWQFKDWPFKDHVEIFNKSEFLEFWSWRL